MSPRTPSSGMGQVRASFGCAQDKPCSYIALVFHHPRSHFLRGLAAHHLLRDYEPPASPRIVGKCSPNHAAPPKQATAPMLTVSGAPSRSAIAPPNRAPKGAM